MDKRTEIRLAGEGGQGMILAGIILAEAAAIYDGKQAAQTQSYGPEARGGASRRGRRGDTGRARRGLQDERVAARFPLSA